MATIRAYTTIEQSRKLAEFLPLESADMQWIIDDLGESFPFPINGRVNENEEPCWSLASLLAVLPKIHGAKPILDLEENSIQYTGIDLYVTASNPVDACYELILKLHELKML